MMSSTTSTSSSNTNNSPTIQSLQGPNDALPHIKQFEKLSSDTEMDGYKEPQWRFLLSGSDVVTAAIIQSSGDNNKDDGSISTKLGGSACKVSIDENTYGLGMVLVGPSNRGKGLQKLLLIHQWMDQKMIIKQQSIFLLIAMKWELPCTESSVLKIVELIHS